MMAMLSRFPRGSSMPQVRRASQLHRLASLIVVALMVPACSRAMDPAVLEDAQLTVRVRTALVNDPEVGAYAIEVIVRLGVVMLTGRVATEPHVLRATELVRSVPGVREVTSALTVDPTAGTPEPSAARSDPGRAILDAELLADVDSPSPGLLAIGASVSRSLPRGDEFQSALGVGPLLRLGSGQGLGVGIGFSWFRTDLKAPGAPGRSGTLKVRPVMAGLAYTARRGRSSASLSLVGGWAFNGLDIETRSAGPVLAVDVDDSAAARAGVSVWIDLSHRTAFNTFIGYLTTRPRVTFLEDGRFESRSVPANVVLVSAGLAYKFF